MSNKLTAADFEMQWDAEHRFSFTESEDATIMAYGHLDPVSLAAEVTEYDKLAFGRDWDPEYDVTEPSAVDHKWAVLTDGGPGDEWQVKWGGVTADTPDAFPVSVVVR